MDTEKLVEQFIERINNDVFGKMSVQECRRIYNEQDISTMTKLLKSLHKSFCDVYKTDCLDAEYGMVLLPAVIHSKNSDLLTIGIVTVDLQSSGEHWGTSFLTSAGIVDLEDCDDKPALREALMKQLVPYDYYYTPIFNDDIHINKDLAPGSVREMLNACYEPEPDIFIEPCIEDEDLEL